MHKFDHEEVVRFCREHMPVLLPRRWLEKRLEFVELIACAPKHADELDPGRKKGTSGLGKKRLPEQSREEKVVPITTKNAKKQGMVS